MHNTIVKRPLLFISMFIVMAMACDLTVTVAPSTSPASLPTNNMIPASGTPNLATVAATQILPSLTPIPATVAPNVTPDRVEVSAGPLSIVLPTGLASGA